jgi:hypothetical protein
MKSARLAAILAMTAVATTAHAQSDPWAALRFLEGKWEGTVTGQPGKGVNSREYRFDLNGRFLSARSRSVYEPKAPGDKPEVHEDLGMYSYDQMQKKLVLRQFHVEGFVNEYTGDPAGEGAKSFEFTTVRIENFRDGWRAKESYRVLSPNEFVETFSLAAPGREFELYSETHLTRVKFE